MSSPTNHNKKSPNPPLPCVMNVINHSNSPWDNISHLSPPSAGGVATLDSPLKAADVGVPETPPQRIVKPIDEKAFEVGYDSDGQRPPWDEGNVLDIDGPELEEIHLPIVPPPISSVEPDRQNVAEKLVSSDEVPKMPVKDLKIELKKRGIKNTGKKAELVSLLTDALAKGVPLVENLTKEKAQNLAGEHFSPGAYWEELVCDGEYVEEETLEGFRAPTVPDGEKPTVRKRQFKQLFDRMVFTGKAEVPERYANGRLKKNKDGKIHYITKPHNETTVRMAFVRKHKLKIHSHPAEWFAAFIPIKQTDNPQIQPFSIEACNAWTNMKAMQQNAGLGGKYSDFKPFSLNELMQHIGLYLLQALSPSPQIEMKFKSQTEDPVNGNDLVHSSFGGVAWKSIKRHRHFKSFFASVNPIQNVPPQDTHPNWKIHPLLKHMLKISKEAVFLGRDLSCDEQTIGFQGNHRDKQRITYKKEGDGFLADCICSDGYTYAFHFRHQPASEKVIKKFSCSPLHARALGLISQLPHQFYTLGMDNLYNSAKFCRLAYLMEQSVMVHGVTRPTLRGIPPNIKQEEVKKKKDLEQVRHTVKAAILKGDSVCPSLVSVSLYDTKPVYFLSNACDRLEWITKERKVYNPSTKTTFKMKFHRLNIVDFYNHNMGNVDLADQLRNHYRYDSSWHRNRKWWWAIWWWGFQVMLTNSYILYCKFHNMHDSKKILSHYDYIKQVSLAWISQELYWPQKVTTARKKKRRETEKTQTRSRKRKPDTDIGSASSAGSSRCTKIDDDTLDPMNGKLCIRLNHSFQHFPEKSKNKNPKCGLHRWARGRNASEVQAGVTTCSICRVNLCIQCYHIFHKEAHLLGKKREIAES